MKKYLLLTGLLAILTYNGANAESYYYENGGKYIEQPVQYKEVRYVKKEPKHHYRLTNEDARRYEEQQYYKNSEQSNDRIRPYVGFDIARAKLEPKDSKDKHDIENNLTAFRGVIGARINKNWGIEAFYQMTGDEEKTKKLGDGMQFETSINYKAYGADVIRYIPLKHDFELLAALGLAQYDFEAKKQELLTIWEYYPYATKIDNEEKKDFDSIGVRLGLGVQYNIDENIALQGMFRYVHMTDDEYIKNLIEASLGVRYMF